MYGLQTLSPTLSEFSDSLSDPGDAQPTQFECNDSVANTYVTEHPGSFETPLFTPPLQEVEIGCFEYHDLHFKIIYAWTTTQTVSLRLHDAALKHFRNHSEAMSMDIEFRELAKFMERADRQVTERMYEQEFLAHSRGKLFNSDAAQANARHAVNQHKARAAVDGACTGDPKPHRACKLTNAGDRSSNQTQSRKQRFCKRSLSCCDFWT